jgi:RimJ/RimL family protein N-acetyltransferase
MPVLGPTTLQGKHIRLEPLRREHAPALVAAGQAPEIWAWLPAMPTTVAAMEEWIAAALRAQDEGREVPFTVVDGGLERVIGSTRYMDVQAANRSLEIGWTWYTPEAWRTVVNPEAKYLMLRHAFEDWGAIRVALKTDALNVQSQAAIRKLGARLEGILRNHRVRRDGTIRDTVLFSILDREWPSVKAALERRIADHRGPGILSRQPPL